MPKIKRLRDSGAEMKDQPPRKPAERRCSKCGGLHQFAAYSNRRWNDKNRVCETCQPFTGRKRLAKKVAEKTRAATSENCRAWPLDGKVDKEDTFWRYCNARKNLRPVPDECQLCSIKTLPGNVGIIDNFFKSIPF